VSEIFTILFRAYQHEAVKTLIKRVFLSWHTLCIKPFMTALGKRSLIRNGRLLPMGSQDESPGLVSIFGPPAAIAVSVSLLCFLPSQVQVVLTVWTLASFPIGVLFGHCVLSED
jgi:hypothetical protein